jgi:hypothetical protein
VHPEAAVHLSAHAADPWSRKEDPPVEHELIRPRISKEAWVAVSGIGAAVITGLVTLLTYVLPPGQHPPVPASSTAVTGSSSATGGAPVDRIAGSWKGTAKDANGTVFEITLDVDSGCTLDQRCGSISVSHVPCYGQIFLAAVDGDEVEFRVGNFDGRSDRAVCQPGAGEHFRLQPDGRLAYRTTYDPHAVGTLERK